MSTRFRYIFIVDVLSASFVELALWLGDNVGNINEDWDKLFSHGGTLHIRIRDEMAATQFKLTFSEYLL